MGGVLTTVMNRHAQNPLITAQAFPEKDVVAVFNPAAMRLPEGDIGLLVRVRTSDGHSHLRLLSSTNGFTDWILRSESSLTFRSENINDQLLSVEDARVSRLDDTENYMVTCTVLSRSGPAVAGMITKDFLHFQHLGTLLPVENKNAAVFPRQIGGKWRMLHRPTASAGYRGAGVWICESIDLRHWGNHRLVFSPRERGDWDGFRVGVGPPPLEDELGWVVLYHGVCRDAGTTIHRLGAILLDRNDPTQVLRRPASFLMAPEAAYERSGDAQTVFCNGCILDESRDTITLYYGAGDTSICAATAAWSEIRDGILAC